MQPVKPRLREQRRDPPHQPRVVDDHLEHRLGAALQRVRGVARERDRRVVAVEHGEPAARPQHAVRLGEGLLALRHMAQRRVEHDGVEARVLEVERAGVADHEVRGHVLGELARPRDEQR